eukprot:CAMPEP_0119046694 /NCGR_PEP_ID=MMETSP1177-20130426/48300_1 /TAXON_ID=2985 /ORGANISM="Ochromonas sp, Strain CCMP1899" /LENGTH=105 /DNA_ID=CAMNT_0007020205 /DNA_START=166 /DNA_END=479 /DNA_ORIENTATION=-
MKLKSEGRTWSSQHLDLCDVNMNHGCVDFLEEIKEGGKKHWDVIGITIDHQPSLLNPNTSSLSILKGLDLVFMRPKFILIRLGPRKYSASGDYASELLEDVEGTL